MSLCMQVFAGIRKTDLYNLTSDVNFENFGSALFYLTRFLSGAFLSGSIHEPSRSISAPISSPRR